MEIIARENLVTVINHREGWRTEELSEDPLIIPRRITEKWTPQFIDELPQVFCGKRFCTKSFNNLLQCNLLNTNPTIHMQPLKLQTA